MHRRRLVGPGSALGLALLLSPSLAQVSPSRAQGTTGPPAGCSSTRVAVAYDASGKPLSPKAPGAPAPCMVATGYGSAETHISVTGDGSVVEQPAAVEPGLLGTDVLPGAPGPRPQ